MRSVLTSLANHINVALACPRSQLLNIGLFGWEGMRIPVIFSNYVKVKGLQRGSIRVKNPTRFGVRIGFGASSGVSRNRAAVIVANNGYIEFDGMANLCEGNVMRVEGGRWIFA